MIDLKQLKDEFYNLKDDLDNNYDKILNIYLKLLVEYHYLESSDDADIV